MTPYYHEGHLAFTVQGPPLDGKIPCSVETVLPDGTHPDPGSLMRCGTCGESVTGLTLTHG